MIKITEPSFDETEVEMVSAGLASKWVTQGPMTKRFEAPIAENQNAALAMACTYCTAALHLATMALGLKPCLLYTSRCV